VSEQPPWGAFGQQDPRQGQPQYPPQQPFGQQPYPPQAYQAPGQMPPGRRGRKSWPARHKILTALGAVTGLIVVISVAAAAASGGGHTVTTGQPGSTSSAAPSATHSASKAASGTATIGSAITLTGNGAGEQVSVTVARVLRHAQPATDMDTPASGKRLYAVQFRLNDTGSAAYSDSPSNGAVVVDASGQSYQSSLDDAAGCESFPGTENIAAGQSGLGCIVFEVPAKAVITGVQFTLDSGMGPQTGQWGVRS